MEKQVTFTITNTYSTLNELTAQTKNIWIVFHGMGYLSRYFIKFFDEIPAKENYIIAPQAPSKYYLKNEYRHVGASWLTKENTTVETENVMTYLDAVLEAEKVPRKYKLIIFGFSQGVSIAMRWVVHHHLRCDRLVLYAGAIPQELEAHQLNFLIDQGTEITAIVGNKDEYINEKRLQVESRRIESFFRGKAKQIVFEGGHELKKELINTLV